MVDIARNVGTTGRPATLPENASQPRPAAMAGHQAATQTERGSLSMPVRRDPTPSTRPAGPDNRLSPATRYVLAAIRIALGFVFLWAFLDKMFGLGHDTASAKSWLNGGNPTKGFLGSASAGPFKGFYHAIAGTTVVNVLFMAALLAIGTALILGIGMRLAAISGAVLTVMMWSVVLPPASNPFMDDHLIYAAVLILLALLAAGDTAGLGRAWSNTTLVKRASWLK